MGRTRPEGDQRGRHLPDPEKQEYDEVVRELGDHPRRGGDIIVKGSVPLRRSALPFIQSHSSATGVFWLNCRVVYFRFGAEMTDASSKMDVRRLKVGYLLIQILVHCALVGLVFFVRSRSASQCVQHGCRKASMRQFPMNALRKTPVASVC